MTPALPPPPNPEPFVAALGESVLGIKTGDHLVVDRRTGVVILTRRSVFLPGHVAQMIAAGEWRAAG